jgi:hypothetical protein
MYAFHIECKFAFRMENTSLPVDLAKIYVYTQTFPMEPTKKEKIKINKKK